MNQFMVFAGNDSDSPKKAMGDFKKSYYEEEPAIAYCEGFLATAGSRGWAKVYDTNSNRYVFERDNETHNER